VDLVDGLLALKVLRAPPSAHNVCARAGGLTILPSSSVCSGELIPGVEDVEVRG
jgi:hypothetical protein